MGTGWLDTVQGLPRTSIGEIHVVDWIQMTALDIWAHGAKRAGSVDPTAVRDALLTAKDIPHIMGPSNWWGEELFGTRNVLGSPQYVTELRNGEIVLVGQYDIPGWYEENKDYVLKWMGEYNLLYYQR